MIGINGLALSDGVAGRRLRTTGTLELLGQRLSLVKSAMDRLSAKDRSHQMSLVKSKNTGPELAVRKIVFSMGHRYRLHGSGLPGKPDLVFARKKKVIFVHGCFWHRHEHCKNATTPASNTEYWLPKFAKTVERDCLALEDLHELGWEYLVVWECELKNMVALAEKLRAFLNE